MSFRRGETDRIREPRTAGMPMVAGYFREVAPEDYELVAEVTQATHGLIDTSGLGDWEIVPLEQVDGSVRLLRVGADRYMGV